MSKWMTKKEVVAELNMSTRTLDRLRSRGLIKAYKAGATVRFLREEVEEVFKQEKPTRRVLARKAV